MTGEKSWPDLVQGWGKITRTKVPPDIFMQRMIAFNDLILLTFFVARHAWRMTTTLGRKRQGQDFGVASKRV